MLVDEEVEAQRVKISKRPRKEEPLLITTLQLLRLRHAAKFPRGLIKTQMIGPHCRVYDSRYLGWVQKCAFAASSQVMLGFPRDPTLRHYFPTCYLFLRLLNLRARRDSERSFQACLCFRWVRYNYAYFIDELSY